MKRLSLILAFMISIPWLFAAVVFPDTVPEDSRRAIEESLGRISEGRIDAGFSVASYSEESIDDTFASSFVIQHEERSIRIEAFGRGRKAFLEDIDKGIQDAFFYISEPGSADVPTLDYIYRDSYSSITLGSMRPGKRVAAVDLDGRTRGVFEAGSSYDDAVLLSPLYLNKPFPGMRLENRGSWMVDGSVSASIPFGSFEACISLGRTDLIYPLVPIISVSASYSSGYFSIFGGVGIEGYLSLSRVFRTSFTLIEEGRIGARALILAGYSKGGFAISSEYSLFYEHRALPFFFYRLGYQYRMEGKHGFMVSLGGEF